jgi:two-component system phosphate regulon sensor histidine kinase PhoR
MDLALLTSVLLLIVAATFWWQWLRARRELERALDLNRKLREHKPDDGGNSVRVSARFEALAAALPDPMLVLDNDRRVVFANPAALRMWDGLPSSQPTLIELSRSYELDRGAEDLTKGDFQTLREVNLNGRLFRVLGARATAGETVLVLRDVSELQRLGRARRDFVANLSHELRTPLTAIRLLLDTSRGSAEFSLRPEQTLDQIGAQVDTLTQIAQEMYDLSLIESGQLPMKMAVTPLRGLAEDVIERMSPQANRAGIALRNDVPDGLSALVDVEQIVRVLSNLMHNAIKFTAKGEVSVFAGPSSMVAKMRAVPDDFLVVGVRDTGIGIPKAEQSRIFERFYKISRARGSGTGLGLAISKHIVEAHGGQIWVDSAEGKGATFYFSIPLT